MLVARSLQENKAEILAANQLDIEQATTEYLYLTFFLLFFLLLFLLFFKIIFISFSGLSGPLLKRLKLTEQKIDTLADGIRCIARQVEPLGQVSYFFNFLLEYIFFFI